MDEDLPANTKDVNIDLKSTTKKPLSIDSQYKSKKIFGKCCIAAKQGMGHSDYCKNSPNYDPKVYDPRIGAGGLPTDPFAPAGKYL